MRVFQKFSFTVKNRSISDIFEMVDTFLKENGLQYSNMGYCFHNLVSEDTDHNTYTDKEDLISDDENAEKSDLVQLAKEYPHLGPVRSVNKFGMLRENILTNIGIRGENVNTDMEEDSLRDISARYQACHMLFSYMDLDFFGRRTNQVGVLAPGEIAGIMGRKSSHITFVNDPLFNHNIELNMVVEITASGRLLDASRYARSLSGIIGVDYTWSTELGMTASEKNYFLDMRSRTAEQRDTAAQALKQYCKEAPFVAAKFPASGGSKYDFSVMESMDTLAEKYGFNKFRATLLGRVFASRRTVGGHQLTLYVEAVISWHVVNLSVHISGIGFCHSFYMGRFRVENQESMNQILDASFEIIERMEKEHFSAICMHYLETPVWYWKDELQIKNNLDRLLLREK